MQMRLVDTPTPTSLSLLPAIHTTSAISMRGKTIGRGGKGGGGSACFNLLVDNFFGM